MFKPNPIIISTNYWHHISSPMLKLSSGSLWPPLLQHPMLEDLASPSATPICHRELSNIGKQFTFPCGTSIWALSKIHGCLVICSQKHSISGMRCFPHNTPDTHCNGGADFLPGKVHIQYSIIQLIHFQYFRPSKGRMNGVEALQQV